MKKKFVVASIFLYGLLAAGSQLQPELFQQLIDHSVNSSGATFAQRYWVDSEFAIDDSSPVLFHICGEWDVDKSYYLDDYTHAWAKAIGARIVYLEHRYYGKSQPFVDLTTEHLRYLTLDNALEDLASFQKWIIQKETWKGSWVAIGGSYSGTLSAFYRQKHPELVVGALAASAPMASGIGTFVDYRPDLGDFASLIDKTGEGDRQWLYQSCTSVGFWDSAGDTSEFDPYLPNPEFCQQFFGNIPLVDYKTYKQKYYDPFLANSDSAPTNILFTYGTNDVWTKVGLVPSENQNPHIDFFLIEGGGHHTDLDLAKASDSKSVLEARELFLTFVKKWLGMNSLKKE